MSLNRDHCFSLWRALPIDHCHDRIHFDVLVSVLDQIESSMFHFQVASMRVSFYEETSICSAFLFLAEFVDRLWRSWKMKITFRFQYLTQVSLIFDVQLKL